MSSTNFFDFLKDILKHKEGDLMTEENRREFKPWLMMNYLSHIDDFAPLINFINKYQFQMNARQMYQLLVRVIPRRSEFIEYVKAEEEDEWTRNVKSAIADRYNISMSEAEEYMELLDREQMEEFLMQYGENPSEASN